MSQVDKIAGLENRIVVLETELRLIRVVGAAVVVAVVGLIFAMIGGGK